MESLVLVTEMVATVLARTLEGVRSKLSAGGPWPDTVSGFADRILGRADWARPDFMTRAVPEATASHFRRTPNLAAYGYVLETCDAATSAAWLEGIEHLRGREIFPADRESFIYNPVEVLGIAAGLASRPSASEQAQWFAETILRGFKAGHFRTLVTVIAARTALRIVAPTKAAGIQLPRLDLVGLGVADLILIAGMELAFGDAIANPMLLQEAVTRRLLSEPIAVSDYADAAVITVISQRIIDSLSLGSQQTDPTERIISLCRRFPHFVERLQRRQHGRQAFEIIDEYDVQDLLHAILRLHFDDVRPEEYTPSYGGNSSRVDFYLPGERIVVEAKMTRKNLKQREVTDELVIDAARYSQMTSVDTLICLVYDPLRLCHNPKTVENDVANSGGRLKVRAVVCPQGL